MLPIMLQSSSARHIYGHQTAIASQAHGEVLPGGGLYKEELVRRETSKADMSTIQKHRAGTNNDEYAMIYNKSERVQTGAAS